MKNSIGVLAGMTTLLLVLPGVQSGDAVAGGAAGQQPAAQGSGAPAQLKSGSDRAPGSSTRRPRSRARTPPRSSSTKDGLVAAWFGGTGEGRPDVGIWVVAARARRVDAAGRSGDRRPARRHAPPVLESRAVRRCRTRRCRSSTRSARARRRGGAWFARLATAGGRGPTRGACPTASSARSRTSRCGSPTAR